MIRPSLILLATFTWMAPHLAADAKPPSREEAARQTQVLESLQESLKSLKAPSDKIALVKKVMHNEPAVDVRGRILELAATIPGAECEAFLTEVLQNDADADAGLRSRAATALGLTGSEKCLPILAEAAANDATTRVEMGDIVGRSSARRSATFALADLASRHPKIAMDAIERLKKLSPADVKTDNESLADARLQSLYQLTRDEQWLAPFQARLKSGDAAERERGVVAYQFLKLQVAPEELIQTLHDESEAVRLWAALVLGGIADPNTADVLQLTAKDTKEAAGVRCNAIYSLGRMRVLAAKDLLESLLADPQPAIVSNAAIALYRITGKKPPQFPEGYQAD